MSHYIHVTLPDNSELDSYLNVSGNISNFYKSLGATECDAGVSGDGIKGISRETIQSAIDSNDSRDRFSEFLEGVLDESDSEHFIFHFS